MLVPQDLHPWRVTPAHAVRIQRQLAARVRPQPLGLPIRFVAGVDCAFTRDKSRCLSAAVVWDLVDRRVLEQATASRRLHFPYIPGLLSFREAPAALSALRRLRHTVDALMCDAHGMSHPRRFGLACHLGLICTIPSLGCAKSRLIGSHRTPGSRRGARTALRDRSERVGTVLRTRDGVRPVFVSVGHLIDLPTAERLVLRAGEGYRLPEPTRLADRLVGEFKKES